MVGTPNTKGFIVDGFPRELEQGKEFENEVIVLLIYASVLSFSKRIERIITKDAQQIKSEGHLQQP